MMRTATRSHRKPAWPGLIAALFIGTANAGITFKIEAHHGDGEREKPLTHPVSLNETLRFSARSTGAHGTDSLITGYWRLSDAEGRAIAGTRLPWQIEADTQPPDYRFIGEGLEPGAYRAELHYWVGSATGERVRARRFTLFRNRWIDATLIGGERANSTRLTIKDALAVPVSIISRSRRGIEESNWRARIIDQATGRTLLRHDTRIRQRTYPHTARHSFTLNTSTLPLQTPLIWRMELSEPEGSDSISRTGTLSILPWKLTIRASPSSEIARLCLRPPDFFKPPFRAETLQPYAVLRLDQQGCATLPNKHTGSIKIRLTDRNGLRALGHETAKPIEGIRKSPHG